METIKPSFINKRDAITVVTMVVMSFIVENTLGLVLLPLIGLPLVGGFLSSIVDAIIIFLGVYLVPRKGSALLFGFLLLTMSIPTPSFGPPGWYKPFIGVGLGLIIEVILMIFKRGKISHIFATAVAFGGSIPMTFLGWKLYRLPTDLLEPHLLGFTLAYAALGAIGASIAAWLYTNRLSKFSLIQKLRAGE